MSIGFKLDELETPRLKLRQLATADAAQLAILRSDERVNRYLGRPASTTIEEALQFVGRILSANSYYWAITFKNDPNLIGTACLWNLDRGNSVVEIGYELLSDFHRQGLMMEVLPALIAYNADVLKFQTITGTTHSENIPSIKLLEKNNFKRDKRREQEYYANGGPQCEIVYSLATA